MQINTELFSLYPFMKKFYHSIPQNHFYVLIMKSRQQIDTNEVSYNNVWFKCIVLTVLIEMHRLRRNTDV